MTLKTRTMGLFMRCTYLRLPEQSKRSTSAYIDISEKIHTDTVKGGVWVNMNVIDESIVPGSVYCFLDK